MALFRKGLAVTIDGLETIQFNGAIGVIDRYRGEDDRWIVCVGNEPKKLAIKANHLKVRYGLTYAERQNPALRAAFDAIELDGTPLMFAAKINDKALAALLLEKSKRTIPEAMLLGDAKQPWVDRADRYGCTAMMHAARGGHVDVAALLITNGASFDKVSHAGHTALDLAADKGRDAVVKLFLRKGVLASMLGSESHTARQSATSYMASLSPAVLASHANTIVPLLQSRVADVRASALFVLDKVSLAEVAARSKMIARLLTHLGRTFPGIHTPLLHYFDPLTRRSLIEAVVARRNDAHASVRQSADMFIRMRFALSNMDAAGLVTHLGERVVT